MDGERARTAVLADSSRPDSPSTFTDLQPVQPGGRGGLLHQGAASDLTVSTPQCADSFFYPEYHQLHFWNHEEYPYQAGSGSYMPPFGWSAASSHTYNEAASMMFPAVVGRTHSFLAELFKEDSPNCPLGSASFLSTPPAPPDPPAPPAPPALHHQYDSLRERKENKRPQVYIKKPLNAFMLFMKEQRSTVTPAIRRQGSWAVNAYLGSVWKSLSRAEKRKYYEEAEEQRLLHQQQHPGWSNKDNYGKMRAKAEKSKL